MRRQMVTTMYNNVKEHAMVKNSKEADQLAIYKRGRGVELETIENNTSGLNGT